MAQKTSFYADIADLAVLLRFLLSKVKHRVPIKERIIKMRTAIINGNIILPNKIEKNKAVIINEGKIEAIVDNDNLPSDCELIDARGNYVSPGFVDMHVHGGGGYSFMDGDVESFVGVARAHAEHGTTSLLPTTLACTFDELIQALDVFKDAKNANVNGANMLGFNLEGPYFSLEQCGAQNPEYITPPKVEEYTYVTEKYGDIILMWCSAPELKGAEEFASYLKAHNIVASIAHTNADYDDVVKGVNAGYRHVTHLYSGMTGVFRVNSFRHAGVVESAFLIDDLTVEIIADGCHLPKALLQLIYKIKGADNIALVTDATNAAGQDVTESILGSKKNGIPVIVEDGVAKLYDRQSFAGSVATTDRLVRNMYKLAGVELFNAVKMASLTPSRIIKADAVKGSIDVGKDADIIIFDDNINVKRTIIGGRSVFINE